jgi:putative ABC transport system substrate-binding protein
MRRRAFISLLGGAAAAWPLVASAQKAERVRRIGVLIQLAESNPDVQAHMRAFRDELGNLGWNGRNSRMTYRFAASDLDRLRAYAVELVGAEPDLIFTDGTPSLTALLRETRTIPIVFAQVVDPVAAGFVSSLARPGGNATGFSQYEYAIYAKWLELLKEIAPRTTRALVIYEDNATSAGGLRAIEAGAPTLGVKVTKVATSVAGEAERAIEELTHEPNGGLIVLGAPTTTVLREPILALAIRHRLPTVTTQREWTAAGALMSYGVDVTEFYRHAADYVDRVLKGEKPGELPVQQATKFEFAINLQTAKLIGLEVPPSLLARADEVIE